MECRIPESFAQISLTVISLKSLEVIVGEPRSGAEYVLLSSGTSRPAAWQKVTGVLEERATPVIIMADFNQSSSK